MTSGKNEWSAIGKSVRGATHIKNGLPCQDAIAIQKTETFCIVAISDGHGSSSCPYSDEGAVIAVQTALTVFDDIFDQPDSLNTLIANRDLWLPKQIEKIWKQKVQENHTQKRRNENDENHENNEPANLPFSYELYGATLIVVVATLDFVFALQIGDGDILMVDETTVDWLIAPDENLGPETNSLCQHECWQYMKTQILSLEKDNPMFLIATDGYANSFYQSKDFAKVGSDFYSLLKEKGRNYIDENLESWLNTTSEKGSGDDITLAILLNE
ncbi:MAG: protein phosphatase 2C domain-containing protein [Firmicutes bacterium]|nr:protein phosphatase 2C domain-containing protein [Bacillota bacterium]